MRAARGGVRVAGDALAGVIAEGIKAQLAERTEAAIAAGVVGVPTVLAFGQSFWGDDHLETAATAMRDHLL